MQHYEIARKRLDSQRDKRIENGLIFGRQEMTNSVKSADIAISPLLEAPVKQELTTLPAGPKRVVGAGQIRPVLPVSDVGFPIIINGAAGAGDELIAPPIVRHDIDVRTCRGPL